MFWIVAFAIWTHEKLFDKYLVEVQNAYNKIVPGTAGWWVETVKYFQHGDKIQFINDKFKYALEDPEKKIIKQCAVLENNGVIYIKVCKDDGNGNLVKLVNNEENALRLYINDIKPLGIPLIIINDNADLLNIEISVKIDTSIIFYDSADSNGYNGSLITDKGNTYPIIDTINNYIHQLDNYNFGGIFQVSHLLSNIINTTGIIDCRINICEAKKYGGNYLDVLATDLQEYNTISGYLNIDTITINYL
jgi:hypothetical protein